MSLDLNAMALFVRVVENRSFSETARRVGIPISTVSRKISELEKSLKIRLLERTTRKLRLTEMGQVYYEYCRRGLEEFEAGIFAVNDRQSEVSGTLRISAPPNLGDVLIAPMVCAFQKKYPKMAVKVFITERNLDFIRDGIDIALRVGKLDDSALIAQELIQYRHILVASKQYLELSPPLRQPKDLASHRLITFGGWHEQTIWKLTNRSKVQKLKVNSLLCINDYSALLYAIEQGQGIAEIPAIIGHSHLQSGRITEVLTDWHFNKTKLSIVYPSNQNISRITRLFIEFCIAQIKQWKPI